MKYALICAMTFSLAACAVDVSTAPEPASPEPAGPQSSPVERTSAPSAPSIIDTCSTQSVGFCAGQPFNTMCNSNPRLWCLWSNELPNGEMLCECGGAISN